MANDLNWYDQIIANATEVYRRHVNPNATTEDVERVYQDTADSPSSYLGNCPCECLMEDDETWEDFVKRQFEEEFYFFEGYVFSQYPCN